MINKLGRLAANPRAIVLTSLLIGACASTSSSTAGNWQGSAGSQSPVNKVIIFAFSPDANAREAFEQSLSRAVSAGGTEGIAGHRYARLSGTSELTKDTILALVEKSGADAVIVTRVMNTGIQGDKTQEEAILHVGPTATVTQNEDASMSAVMVSNYAVEVVPGSTMIKANTVLETTVYKIATGEVPVYRATTNAHYDFDAGTRIEEAVHQFATDIDRKLRKDGVIR